MAAGLSYRLVYALALALLIPRASFAQDASPWFTRAGFAPAYVVSNNPFLLTASPVEQQIGAVPSMTLEIGRQTDGSSDWHHAYGLPSYGFGVSIASPGAGAGVSRPVDAYTFFSWPFAQPSEHVQITTDFGMGLSWNWKAFNPQTRAYEAVLGSNVNARIDWGFYVRYIMTPQTSLYAGVDYTHRSNGGMRQPDFGINVLGPSIAVRHNFAPEHLPVAIVEPPPFHPAWELVVGGAGGVKNVMLDGNSNLPSTGAAFDATAALQRHFYRFGKLAAGTDVTHDGTAAGRLAVAPYAGYEHVIGRFGAIVQVGYKVVNNSDEPDAARLYERYGWRYHFNDHYWSEFAIRGNGHRADFLEVGAGYRTAWR